MNDIVERLRSWQGNLCHSGTPKAECWEAADEIESLRSRTEMLLGLLDVRESELVAARSRLAKAEDDAALGRIALRFVDRAGDYCGVDPAERICDEFHAAMATEVERQRHDRGVFALRTDSATVTTGEPK